MFPWENGHGLGHVVERCLCPTSLHPNDPRTKEVNIGEGWLTDGGFAAGTQALVERSHGEMLCRFNANLSHNKST